MMTYITQTSTQHPGLEQWELHSNTPETHLRHTCAHQGPAYLGTNHPAQVGRSWVYASRYMVVNPAGG